MPIHSGLSTHSHDQPITPVNFRIMNNTVNGHVKPMLLESEAFIRYGFVLCCMLTSHIGSRHTCHIQLSHEISEHVKGINGVEAILHHHHAVTLYGSSPRSVSTVGNRAIFPITRGN